MRSFRVCRNSPPIPDPAAAVRKQKFTNRSNSTLLDHCNLPALFSTHETPIVPTEILKKRNSIGAAQLKKSKLSINFDNQLLEKTQPSEEDEDDEEEDDVMEVLTPNQSQKKKRKRVRKRKPKVNGNQSTPRVENGSNGVQKNGSAGGKRVNGKQKEQEETSNKRTK